MNNFKVILSREAKGDIRKITDWYTPKSQSAVRNFFQIVLNWRELLSRTPWAGFVVLAMYRRVVLRPYPYCMYYTVDETAKTIEIVAVIHQKRSPQTIRKILKSRN
jgi:toxin ParE1/3/4